MKGVPGEQSNLGRNAPIRFGDRKPEHPRRPYRLTRRQSRRYHYDISGSNTSVVAVDLWQTSLGNPDLGRKTDPSNVSGIGSRPQRTV